MFSLWHILFELGLKSYGLSAWQFFAGYQNVLFVFKSLFSKPLVIKLFHNALNIFHVAVAL